jgi:hypothetical protein
LSACEEQQGTPSPTTGSTWSQGVLVGGSGGAAAWASERWKIRNRLIDYNIYLDKRGFRTFLIKSW